MPRSEVAGSSARRTRPSIVLPLALALSLGVSMLPIFRVIESGQWAVGAAVGILVILGIGWIARSFHLTAVLVFLTETLAAVAYITAVFARESSFAFVIPTGASLRDAIESVQRAMDAIVTGAAPLPAGGDLSFLLVTAAVMLTLVLDHVVITTRMPLLGAIALIAVYLSPSLAVRSDVNIGEFMACAASLLLLFAVDTRVHSVVRGGPAPPPVSWEWDAPRAVDAPASGGAFAATAAVGAVAIVAAVVIAPVLPEPAPVNVGGLSGATIDPTLSLGESLRLPEPVEVLRLQTDASSPQYLRAVTLTDFDGSVWQPDIGVGIPLDEVQWPSPTTDDAITLAEISTDVTVVEYASPWLPVPFPATSVSGLDGEWLGLDENRTVLTQESSPRGQEYTVTSEVPRPTLEQIRATQAGLDQGVMNELLFVTGPRSLTDPIRETAEEITAGATSDYDRLISLQNWFRSDFEYSLEAPVENGFDGSGLEAINAFLQERTGYCVHFASSFAVMARELGMPARIVVGYLPGTSTGETDEGRTVYTVSSSQLHAWPEVHFAGIGWVPFEPTASLGRATRFWPESAGGVDDAGNPLSPEPTAAPSIAPTRDPLDEETAPVDAGTGVSRPWVSGPVIAIVLGVLAVLIAPATARLIRRAGRQRAARTDAGAAWIELVDSAIDLGIDTPAGESPRAFGRRLIVKHGAPRREVDELVAAVERASYSGGRADAPTALAQDLRVVLARLREDSDRRSRLLATFAPRSLIPASGPLALRRG